MNLGDNAILVADDLSDQERLLLELMATPSATLLGAVSDILRTTLFGEDPAGWVDMWQARHNLARVEWLDGAIPVELHLTRQLS